jgi:hypothetical protein
MLTTNTAATKPADRAASDGLLVPSSGETRHSTPNCLPDLKGSSYGAVLQQLHKLLRPKSYFEIGTLRGGTLKLAECPSIAVDPQFQVEQNVVGGKRMCALYQMTSDDFFAAYDPKAILGRPIDFAFLDGMHLCEYLLRDFANTEKHCRKNSVIFMHDCAPVEPAIAERRPNQSTVVPHRAAWWAGDVWRTVLALKKYRPDLAITALDASPTGLICVSNLNPQNTSIMDRYMEIVGDMMSYSFDRMTIEEYFRIINVEPTSVIDTHEKLSTRFWL